MNSVVISFIVEQIMSTCVVNYKGLARKTFIVNNT